jgi:hypothetical protein
MQIRAIRWNSGTIRSLLKVRAPAAFRLELSIEEDSAEYRFF